MTKHLNFPLQKLSFYKTGGLAKTLYQPESKGKLQEALIEIDRSGEPFFILGQGSNSLISDLDWEGSVLNFNKMKNIVKVNDTTLRAEAGVSNSTFSEFALSQGLGKASWMYGLPGALGATVRMNARCYGGEISQITTKVTSYTEKGEEKIYLSNEGEKHVFKAYKDTIFMSNKEIIAEVELSLEASSSSSIKEKMISCYEDRKAKGQYLNPSCGCVFKNDYRPEVSVPSGLLIDACQLKGQKVGDAMVSKDHANFILNLRSAKSSDILELSFQIREKVWENFGVWLEYEMETLGKFSASQEEKLQEKRDENFQHDKLKKIREKFQSR